MATITIIDPVTRLEGHLKIKVMVDTVNGVQQVVDAWATGTLFRGFEAILMKRHPMDAQHITQRICGVCPVSHGLASVLAQEQAYRVTPPANAIIMRNLVLGANHIDSHILHFYHLAAPDFIKGPDMPPWQPSWNIDRRFSDATTATLVNHYVTALDMRRKAHEMGAIFGGRLPHPPTYIPGGFTTQPTTAAITKFKAVLSEITSFISNTYIPDAQALAATYSDYRDIGGGYGNLLAYGCFDLNAAGTSKLLRRGRVEDGATSVETVDVAAIAEHVQYSWYNDRTNMLNPAVGVTTPKRPKGPTARPKLGAAPAPPTGAYSWLKAPRYLDAPYETGALARMWVNGDYRAGISVMDRHLARAAETLKVAQAMGTWVNQLTTGGAVAVPTSVPATGAGIGLTEAPRGALGHWLQITGGKIARYQIVTPTCWNASPRDTAGQMGPMEKALIGTPVQDVNQPLEVVRVIHSFDPCLSCAVHVMRPGEGKKIFTLGH